MYYIKNNLLKTDDFSLSIKNIDSVTKTSTWYGIISGIISYISMILFFIIMYNEDFMSAIVFPFLWIIFGVISTFSSQLTIKASGKNYKISVFGSQESDDLFSFKNLIEDKISKD